MQKTKARLLITEECNRNCSYCCNHYYNIMKNTKYINSLDELPVNLTEIMITGGEPMLFPQKTKDISIKLKKKYPFSKLYLYTTLYNDELENIIPYLDGVHYSLHSKETINDLELLYKFQGLLCLYEEEWNKKSFRLYVDSKVKLPVSVIPYLWKRMEMFKWSTEEELIAKQPDGLPAGESLYILN